MISFNEIVDNKEYRERVIKFFRLPCRLSVTKEKFLSDLNFIKKTDPERYNMIIKYTEDDFNKIAKEQDTNEPDFTMENILEPLISEIEDSSDWKSFMQKDYTGVLNDYDGITNIHGFYKKENDGKRFVSVDLKAANWQSLKSILGIKENYEDFIRKYTNNSIPPVSKAFRTKITGILGAKQIMLYNQKILRDNQFNILQSLDDNTGLDLIDKKPFAFYADEFLIELDEETYSEFESLDLVKLEDNIYKETGVNVHLRPFILKWLNIDKGCLKDFKGGHEIINMSKDVLMLINKLISNVEINDVDFEKVKLNGKTKEEYLNELKSKLVESNLIIKEEY